MTSGRRPPPSILIVLTDGLGHGNLNCCPNIRASRIDRFAVEGSDVRTEPQMALRNRGATSPEESAGLRVLAEEMPKVMPNGICRKRVWTRQLDSRTSLDTMLVPRAISSVG
jgi:hypothetical protein